MKRRDFVGSLAGFGASTLVLPAGAQVVARAGIDFVKLERMVPVEAPTGKIELIEFFWYDCPHCNAFDPALTQWLKKAPKDVFFKRIPVAFRDDFVPQQRLFYALEAMGLIDKLHVRVFAAIHEQKQNLSKGDAIIDWVVKQGVDKAKFVEHFNSFSVSTKATRAHQFQEAYAVEGVPAFGVAGRFYTDGERARTMDRALQVVEFLLSEVRQSR
jgi:thiol:disulfide interchange protein DsbA